MTMNATVLEVNQGSLLVCDQETCQPVVVHTPCAASFHVSQPIRIQYTGAMTSSLPPQISACCITTRGCRW